MSFEVLQIYSEFMRTRLPISPQRPITALTKSKARKETIDVAYKLQKLGVDPIVVLALFAVGDVVSLGMMTKAEYAASAELHRDAKTGLTVIIAKSGMQRSLDIIPPKCRLDAAESLAQYVYPKRASMSHQNADGSPLRQAYVVLEAPDNGRVKVPPPAEPVLPQERSH
jgi:hypothetical protein